MILETFCPVNRAEWRSWLIKNNRKKDGVWLIFYKKFSPKHNIKYTEARDEALCFGWIDSTIKKIDQDSFKQYYSKRKEFSKWSKLNKTIVEQLIKNGLMTNYGLEIIEKAKLNGAYCFMNDIDNLIVPDDLKLVFKENKTAEEKYNSLTILQKKHILYSLKIIKTEKNRMNKIIQIIEKLSV